MATPAARVWKQSAAVKGAVIAVVSMLLAGCAHHCYQAAQLPPELLAPPAERIEPALLSRLARYRASSELIQQGDLLEVTIDSGYGEDSARTAAVRVAEDGTARVPLVGPILLGGLTLQEAEQAIASAAVRRNVLRDPYVTVTIKQQRTNSVTVLGAVEEPGVKQLPRGSSYLLDALVAAGNLSEDASAEIEIRRPAARGRAADLLPESPQVAQGSEAELASYQQARLPAAQTIRVNLLKAAREGKDSYYLEDGDVVVVGQREPRSIYVMGLVNEPGQYQLPFDRDVHLLDALAMAKGRASQVADKVLIVRQLPGQAEPATIVSSVRRAKRDAAWNLRLAPGDVVSVEETPTTFVLEMVKNLLRFGISGSLPMF